MLIYMLWAQRKCDYPEQYAPELLEAWSEYDIDDNPDGWEAAKAKALAAMEDDLESSVVVTTVVDGSRLTSLLNTTPSIKNSGITLAP